MDATALLKPTYDGIPVARGDGIEIGLGNASKAGGRTIDVSFGMARIGLCTLSRDVTTSSLIRSILLAGVDDWVNPGLIYYFTDELDLDPAERRLMTLAAMVHIVSHELMVPGDVRDGNFAPWTGEQSEWINRIILGLQAAGPRPGPGDVAWFDLTEAGEAEAGGLS